MDQHLDKLSNLGSMLTSKGAKLIEGIKAGAEMLSFRPQLLDFGELKVMTTSLVAEGGYSFVYTAREVTPGAEQGRMFAVKKVIAQEPDTVEVGRTEIRLLETLPPHPHIVRFYGSTVEEKGRGVLEMYMVLEYCPGGSLIELVMPGMPPIPEAKLLSIFHSVCKAVAHLHAQEPPIAHRDLKLENVLCNAAGLYKLCDFGSATTRRVRPDSRAERLREEELIQRFSTLMYRAPEMVDLYRGHEISEKVDVWSLGCILYTLAFHRHPFDAGTELQIVNASVSFPPSSPYSRAVHDLITYALVPDPSQRPAVTQLIARVAQRRAEVLDDEITQADVVQQPVASPVLMAENGAGRGSGAAGASAEFGWDAFGEGATPDFGAALPPSMGAATGAVASTAAGGRAQGQSGSASAGGAHQSPSDLLGAHAPPPSGNAVQGPGCMGSESHGSFAELTADPMSVPPLPAPGAGGGSSGPGQRHDTHDSFGDFETAGTDAAMGAAGMEALDGQVARAHGNGSGATADLLGMLDSPRAAEAPADDALQPSAAGHASLLGDDFADFQQAAQMPNAPTGAGAHVGAIGSLDMLAKAPASSSAASLNGGATFADFI